MTRINIKRGIWFLGTVLFSATILLSKLIFADISPSIITIPREQSAKLVLDKTRTKISGSFVSGENGLGMILLSAPIKRFDKDKILTFQLKTNKDKDWTYTQIIPEINFYYAQPFTVGFPKITDSKDTKINFVLTATDRNKPSFESGKIEFHTKYKFDIKQLYQDPLAFKSFVAYKLQYSVYDKSFYLFFLLSVLPIAFYLSVLICPNCMLAIKKWIAKKGNKWLIAVILLFLVDVFVLAYQGINIFIASIVAFISLLLIREKILRLRVLFTSATVLLGVEVALLIFDYTIYANKVSGWFFFNFFIIFIVLTGLLSRKNK